MQVELVKKMVVVENKTTKEKHQFYTFYLRLNNGMELRVLPNAYEDKNGEKKSNYRELVLVASDELPFDK